MVITLDAELEAALKEVASWHGVAPEELALKAEELALKTLRARFIPLAALKPRDEWERGLLAAAQDCGGSLSNEALCREELYD
jgi:hypothetical protein